MLWGCTLNLPVAGDANSDGDSASPVRPSISKVTPSTGPVEGGTQVAVLGTGFQSGTGVLFGGSPASSVTWVNSGMLTAVTPAHEPGSVEVAVVATDGAVIEMAGAFEFVGSGESPPHEPPTVNSLTPTHGSESGGTLVTVLGENLPAGTALTEGTVVLFGAFAGTDVRLVNDRTLTVITPPQAPGLVDVALLAPEGESLVLPQAFLYEPDETPEPPADEGSAPQVVGAVSTSNTTVELTFTKPMAEGADVPEHYRIVSGEASYLIVLEAALSEDGTTVTLTTLAQDSLLYDLTVIDVKDTFGNQMAPPQCKDGALICVNPSHAAFAGTPASGAAPDSDEDGLTDLAEMRGWTIALKLSNGKETERGVSSDPFQADTDEDGLTDFEEKAIVIDPRNADTDGDQLDDYAEWNEWFSTPFDQDTDNDGFGDGLDVYLKTSPVLADTDGDQLSDSDEVLNRNRNPRISDLPVPELRIGGVSIELNETFSYNDEFGEQRSTTRNSGSSLTQRDEQKYSRGNTFTNESTDKYNQELSAGYDSGPDGGWKVEAKVGFEQTRQRGHSLSFNKESTEATERAFNESISESLNFSERREVTRTVNSARLLLDLTLVNAGDIAFRIKNIEVTALLLDPVTRSSFVPVASLRPQGGNTEFNLGPLDSERGPIVFQNAEIFPERAQHLMREPRGLIFKMGNFDIEDEFGRNFAFASQEVNDRTAGVVIDYGNGEVEMYRVATAGKFDAQGRTLGITLRYALEDILGIVRAAGEDRLMSDSELNGSASRRSYGVKTGTSGVPVLTRVRNVQTDLRDGNPEKRFWVIFASTAIPAEVAFDDIRLMPGETYNLAYVQDKDRDGLWARQEFFYGSSDENPDTDGDTLSDFDEARTGWTTGISGNEYRVHSSPVFGDTDGDGLTDAEERDWKSDPRKVDTDEDGLFDHVECCEGFEVILFDGDDDDLNNPLLQVIPYTDLAIIDGGDGRADSQAASGSDDVQVVPAGQSVPRGGIVIAPGPDGILQSAASGDDRVSAGGTVIDGGNSVMDTPTAGDDVEVFRRGNPVPAGAVIITAGLDELVQSVPAGDDQLRIVHRRLFATNPLARDTDADSLFDGREQFIGSNPNNPKDAGSVVDTDLDGLQDAEETNGWDITVDGRTRHVTSNPTRPDSDGDGLPDLLERIFRLDPGSRDTDADTLGDYREFDIDDPYDYFDDALIDEFERRCAQAQMCQYASPDDAWATNPLSVDSDIDGRSDDEELNDSWTVYVYGADPYEVSSDPNDADADRDGLDDAEEMAAGGTGTDPEKADTDGETVSDGTEIHTRGTDPLRKDKKVTFTYEDMLVIGDCDPGSDGGQFSGELKLRLPDGSLETLFTMDESCDVDEGERCVFDVSWTFILNEGENFVALSSAIKEVDDSGTDEQLGSYNEQYDYETVASGNVTYPLEKDTSCKVDINATIDIQ